MVDYMPWDNTPVEIGLDLFAKVCKERDEERARADKAETERDALRRNVRGWVEWHRRCDADDDCTYLNDNAWCDAEALASTGMGLLARALIQPEPDPLVTAIKDCGYATLDCIEPEFAADLRASLARHGLAVKEVG